MEVSDCLCELVSKLPHLPNQKVLETLKGESKDLEVTKSLLNILVNLVEVGSLPVSKYQRQFLDSHAQVVLRLLSPKTSLREKKSILQGSLDLARAIALACPTAVGS